MKTTYGIEQYVTLLNCSDIQVIKEAAAHESYPVTDTLRRIFRKSNLVAGPFIDPDSCSDIARLLVTIIELRSMR